MKESSVESYFTGRIKALGGESRKVKWIGRRGAPDQLPYSQASGLRWSNSKPLARSPDRNNCVSMSDCVEPGTGCW